MHSPIFFSGEQYCSGWLFLIRDYHVNEYGLVARMLRKYVMLPLYKHAHTGLFFRRVRHLRMYAYDVHACKVPLRVPLRY